MSANIMKERSSEPRILFLSANYEGHVVTSMAHERRAIARVLPESVFYGPGYVYETNYVPDIIRDIYGAEEPDAVFCYENAGRLLGEPLQAPVIERYGLKGDLQFFPRGLDKVKCLKIGFISDFWELTADEWERVLLGNGFSYVFSAVCPPFMSMRTFDRFFNTSVQREVRFIPWPRAVSPEIIRDYGLPKIYDVTLLGCLRRDFYPLRTRMHRTFSKMRDIKYFHQDHPGYGFVSSQEALVGESYARAINQSKIFATCTGIYRIAFQKTYEILGSRTAMLCDEPNGAEFLGLCDNETYIRVNRWNFVRRAKWYLRHEDELERVSNNARQLFLARHTVDVRAQEFKQVITDIIAGKEPGSWASIFPGKVPSHLVGRG